MRLAIIIPVLEEETEIVSALAALAPLRARGVATIVVDGGSRDRTAALAAPLADRVITAARGRPPMAAWSLRLRLRSLAATARGGTASSKCSP